MNFQVSCFVNEDDRCYFFMWIYLQFFICHVHLNVCSKYQSKKGKNCKISSAYTNRNNYFEMRTILSQKAKVTTLHSKCKNRAGRTGHNRRFKIYRVYAGKWQAYAPICVMHYSSCLIKGTIWKYHLLIPRKNKSDLFSSMDKNKIFDSSINESSYNENYVSILYLRSRILFVLNIFY